MEYYSTLRSLWEEIDFCKNFRVKCTKDAALYNKEVKETRIFEFLAGLHPNYEPMRVLILGKDPLPSFDKVFSYLSKEEDRCHIMLLALQSIVDRSTLVTSSQRGG